MSFADGLARDADLADELGDVKLPRGRDRPCLQPPARTHLQPQ